MSPERFYALRQGDDDNMCVSYVEIGNRSPHLPPYPCYPGQVSSEFD